MERALRVSETTLRSLFEHSPIGIAVANSDGSIIQSNAAFETMLGYDKNELIQMTFTDFTHPDDIEKETPCVKEMVEHKRDRYEMEKRYVRKDGKVIWVRLIAIAFQGACGERLGLGMTEDITERRKAEEELRKTVHLLNTVFNGIDDHMYLKDRESRMLMANEAVGNDFGMPVEAMFGKTELEFFEDRELAQTVLDNDKRIMESENTEVIEEEVKLADGMHTFLSKKAPWKDSQGNVIGLFGISRDITDRKQATIKLMESEKRALKLVQELEEINRNKNEFLGALSHELRNPLAAISAGLQLMDATSDEAHIKSAKEIMKRQMDQICSLVDDLLDITRISNNKIELKKEMIELNELAAHTAQDLKLMFDKKGIALHIYENKEKIYTEADPVRIKQIIGNLLHNALKFTENGGMVTLSVRKQNGQAVICVKDTGIGINASNISKLFEPFPQIDKQIDRRAGGLGLGLTIAKAIANLHGGDAIALSEGEGRGASFFIRLPLSCTGKVIKAEIKQKTQDVKILRVLVIEDNKDYCYMMCAMLKHLGYDTDCTHDGIEGIKMAEELRPDVIICDIGLPGMNGYEIARTIRSGENMKHATLIALSGYTCSNDIEAAKRAGFDRHISKPVDLEYLKAVLNGA